MAEDGASSSSVVPKKRASLVLKLSQTDIAKEATLAVDEVGALTELPDEKEELAEVEDSKPRGLQSPLGADPSDPLSESEQSLVRSMVCLALGMDDSTGWTRASTKDPTLTIDYASIPSSDGNDITTVRGATFVSGFDPLDFHRFSEDGPKEEWQWYFDNDELCEEMTCLKRYSKDRALVHARFTAGVSSYVECVLGDIHYDYIMIISYRDMLYMRRRIYFENVTVDTLPNGKPASEPKTLEQLAIGFCYSIPDDHEDQIPPAKSHVRGQILFASYLLFKEKRSDEKCQIVTLASVNPKGSIPQWVVNLAAPAQGNVAAVARDALPALMDLLAKRDAATKKVTSSSAAGSK